MDDKPQAIHKRIKMTAIHLGFQMQREGIPENLQYKWMRLAKALELKVIFNKKIFLFIR
jgi:hypothetical protein